MTTPTAPKLALSDSQRRAIHDLALDARELLTNDVRELLEGVYGLYRDGHFESPDRLPQVQADPDTAETYRRLAQFLDDEARAGLAKPEAIDKLVKEAAFTHLNRLVAFKMMEARKLIRGTLDKGTNSNGFKIYLVDHPDDMARFQHDEVDLAYRHFLLWQAGQIAQEMAVLFDPDTLPSRLFPRPHALNVLIETLNASALDGCWTADETIGWVYQFFNEREKNDVFAGLAQKKKIRRQDIPAATQLFTPNWIVRFLVQNTLGRTWVQMHPDTSLLNTDLLDYLVPLKGEVPAEPLRLVRDITLLDPACGTMHFGLVAFDLFAAMYQEELDRIGEAGWLDTPSVNSTADIASAIVGNNLYGIDIDLRAVQLSALTLYLKAKSLNKNARFDDHHLACADVLPLNGSRLGTFLREMKFSPLIERLIKALWERLKDVNQFGSLLRLDREINTLITSERSKPMFARADAGFDYETSMTEEEFWELIFAQIIQGLDAFAQQQAESGVDMRFFKGEAVKGLRLLDVMLRRHDVVVANPPYSGKRNLNDTLATFLDTQYPDTKGDLYAAFIERCVEMLAPDGRVGMITQQSFMFLSSYETMRQNLRETVVVEAMVHTGARAFAEIGGENVNTTVFILHAETDIKRSDLFMGTYFRLVNAPMGDGKRTAFDHSFATGANQYHIEQKRFDVIPGASWIYWMTAAVRNVFLEFPKLTSLAEPKQGLTTADTTRFIRLWWEVSHLKIGFGIQSRLQAQQSSYRWFLHAKGGAYQKWYGNQEFCVNWEHDGQEIKDWVIHRYPYLKSNWEWVAKNSECYFQEGITWTKITSGKFGTRYMPTGTISSDAGMALFMPSASILFLLGVSNSSIFEYFGQLVSATVNFQAGEIAKIPIPRKDLNGTTLALVQNAVNLSLLEEMRNEFTFDFIIPHAWVHGLTNPVFQIRLADLERQIDDEVYKLYGIEGEDRAAIEAELAGGVFAAEEDAAADTVAEDESGESAPESSLTAEELAVRWISYAVGVVLGRFQPGVAGALGRAVYKQSDFAIGSLPAPDEAEFNLLVGDPERFAYVDAEGGRHVFTAEVESALRALAVPDGITVLDEGHPRDLTALVERALALMLGDAALDEVIRVGAGRDLRKFLSKDFFTNWHFKWYRKRPVYWIFQSAKRSYGFVLFHERFSKYTLYSLLRDYFDYRVNRLRNAEADLNARRTTLEGKALKALEKELETITREIDELNEFGKTMERIANAGIYAGYQPESSWIDDGVILRLAPLWELIPIWKAEPKKYWEKLEAGDFDWSHIAMHYWPDRVRAKCETNKSFAIAHGLEALPDSGA